MLVEDGRTRVVIEDVTPRVDDGAFPIKRIAGDTVTVEADVFADGHDAISCALLYKREGDPEWTEAPMEALGNDRWRGSFKVEELGRYLYTVSAWVDHFKTWSRDLKKRVDANQDVTVDLIIGAEMIAAAGKHAPPQQAGWHEIYAESVRAGGTDGIQRALSAELAGLMRRHAAHLYAHTYEPSLAVVVDRERARFGAWYELFPRSCAAEAGRHGTLADVEAWLPYVAGLGCDVLYLPPIHPIGHSGRKGRNNAALAAPGDPGSPWAIGAAEGGHTAVHPELGTLADFRHLVQRAAEYGLELALDLAFQCAPDHPYVNEHPAWFRHRPDGTIQYAENPPKQYQDIYPFDFESADWRALWDELQGVVRFWLAQGVRIFRVDNPHTKPFAFWAWLIAAVKRDYPEVIFLAEAFTRPKVMQRLAKLGFTQSYTYFTWRNSARELRSYLGELTQPPLSEYFGANLWPNTPDILPEALQYGGRPAFVARLILAATLGPSYGLYGPAFELGVHQPLAAGREEYRDSEKYELKHWELAQPDSLRGLIAQLNQIRRAHAAFHANHQLRFHAVVDANGSANEQLLAYSKCSPDGTDLVLVVVNLDPHYKQAGFLTLGLAELGLDAQQPYQAHDLLSEARYLWHGPRNYVELDPHTLPAHIFVLRRKVRTEHDFDYYL